MSTATSPVTTPSPAPDVGLEQVDGGPDYYGQFSGSLPTSPDYFPIGVWGAYDFTAQNVARDKDVGINTYVWNADTDAWGQQNIAAAGGMYTLQQAGDVANIGAYTRGWMLADEADMRYGPGNDTVNCNGLHPSSGAKSGYQVMREQLAKVPDNRATYANYGKGLVGPQWETDAQASCFVNAFQDITSADLYWHTDPNERARPQSGTSWGYGQTVDRMRQLDERDGRRHPIWNFVEVTWPWGEPPGTGGLDKPTPAEIRGAVWHSIIAGARGITYFQHSFNGPCTRHHALRETGTACYGAVIDGVRAVNAQIRQLAPVLNASTVTSGHSSSPSIRTMVKWQGGNFYVFAGSRSNVSSTGTVSIPCVGDATATRLGEAGSVPISGGSFSDQFADGNTIHIYRIDGGSTCGLPGRPEQSAPGGGGGADEQPGAGGRTARVGRLPKRVSLRSGRLFVPVTCAAVCTVRSRLTTRGASRRVRLAATRRRFDAGRHRLVLRLSKRSRRYVARASKPLPMRLSTVIVEPGGPGARRTQQLVARRR